MFLPYALCSLPACRQAGALRHYFPGMSRLGRVMVMAGM